MRVFDGHLDLAMNALAYGRDQTWPLEALRRREAGHAFDDHRGEAAVCLPELVRGGVTAAVATLFVRASADAAVGDTLRRSDSDLAAPALAHAAAHGQLAYYRLLHRQGRVRLVTEALQLTSEHGGPPAVIVLMEGADAVLDADDVAAWFAAGVRVMSLTHTQATAYAGGNNTALPLTAAGVDLLRAMRDAGIILDVSHLCDASLFPAMDAFDGPVIASHSNCRALCPGARQITDDAIRLIASRGGVVGIALHNGMLRAGWSYPASPRHEVTLDDIARHIDHICQLTGSASHAAIGSDLDGGFGLDRVPTGVDSVADLHRIAQPLRDRGYGDPDIAAILHDNWLNFYRQHLG